MKQKDQVADQNMYMGPSVCTHTYVSKCRYNASMCIEHFWKDTPIVDNGYLWRAEVWVKARTCLRCLNFFFFTNSLTFKSFFLHNKIILDN